MTIDKRRHRRLLEAFRSPTLLGEFLRQAANLAVAADKFKGRSEHTEVEVCVRSLVMAVESFAEKLRSDEQGREGLTEQSRPHLLGISNALSKRAKAFGLRHLWQIRDKGATGLLADGFTRHEVTQFADALKRHGFDYLANWEG